MITLKTVDLWSYTDKKIVPFDVVRIKELDPRDPEKKLKNWVILISYKTFDAQNNPVEEIHRFSPDASDEEISRMVAQMNEEKANPPIPDPAEED